MRKRWKRTISTGRIKRRPTGQNRESLSISSDSDIIVASPLGLRRALEAKAQRTARADDKLDTDEEDEGDYLSSIEICVIDGCEIFAMQNWETLLSAIEKLSRIPKKQRETDFSRVYDWALDGFMKYFRQTIVLSSYPKPECFALFRSFCNHSGALKITEIAPEVGTMAIIRRRVKQTFYRLSDVRTPGDGPEKRLRYFTEKLLPSLGSLAGTQTLVVIPSYYDFVRVRNKMVQLHEDDPSFKFGSISEYSKQGDVFFNRQVQVLLVTERLQFYRELWIRGANTVVFYGTLENARFYPVFVDMLQEAAELGERVEVFALYDQWDRMALERIVGRKRAKRMVGPNAKSTYLFY